MIPCENSGHMIADDFPEVRKIVSAGATSKPVLLTVPYFYAVLWNLNNIKKIQIQKYNAIIGIWAKEGTAGPWLKKLK